MITKLFIIFFTIAIASATPTNFDEENVQVIETTKKLSLLDEQFKLEVTTIAIDEDYLVSLSHEGSAQSENIILREIERAIGVVKSPLCQSHLNATLAGVRQRKSWAMASE